MGMKDYENIVLLGNNNFAYLIEVRKLVHPEEKQEICQLIEGR